MSYKDVLRVFKLERELNDDETATLNTLRKMSAADIEATVEAFGGSMGKSSKSTKPVTKRVIEKCVACDYTRQAAHHKEGHKNYHEFQPSQSSSKSKRAAGLSDEARQRLSRKVLGADGGNHKPSLCAFEVDGKVCHGAEDDAIHDQTMGYAAYHEFQPERAQAATGD